jgi:hypothetical protein
MTFGSQIQELVFQFVQGKALTREESRKLLELLVPLTTFLYKLEQSRRVTNER